MADRRSIDGPVGEVIDALGGGRGPEWAARLKHQARISAYFASCGTGTPADIAAHFTDDAVIWDTNHGPVRTAEGIGRFWLKVRDRWDGAIWTVDRLVSDGETAAIEWTMAGTGPEGPFRFHGSEHYAFDGDRIAEIRQYWIFDRDRLGSGLVDYPYDAAQVTLDQPVVEGPSDPGTERGEETP